MRNEIEEFISQVVLSTEYNNETDGNVEAPTGYFGTMAFGTNETDIDGIMIPEELRGHAVIATENSNGSIAYEILSRDLLAVSWFVSQVEHYSNWCGDD